MKTRHLTTYIGGDDEWTNSNPAGHRVAGCDIACGGCNIGVRNYVVPAAAYAKSRRLVIRFAIYFILLGWMWPIVVGVYRVAKR